MDALFLCGVKSLENTAFELVVFRAEILKCSAMQSKSLNKKPESITHFNPIPITTMKTNQTDKAVTSDLGSILHRFESNGDSGQCCYAGRDEVKNALAEHAALLAVAGAAEDYQRQSEFERMTGNNSDNADKSSAVLSKAIANLAAVREGKAVQS